MSKNLGFALVGISLSLSGISWLAYVRQQTFTAAGVILSILLTASFWIVFFKGGTTDLAIFLRCNMFVALSTPVGLGIGSPYTKVKKHKI